MFAKSETESMLDAEIRATLTELKNHEKTSEEYGDLVDRISSLHKLKAEEKPKRINPDTALVVGANIFGILAIINHERVSVITSKAMNSVIKLR